MNLKKYFSIFATGMAGGILAAGIIMPLLIRANFLNSASILTGLPAKPGSPNHEEEKTVFVPKAAYFSDAINKVEPSVVAIQSFSEGRLTRYGSGVVLTQDGLIATLNSVVPPGVDVFQVTDNGQIYKTKVVFRDYSNNLAIVSATGANLPVVRLESEAPALGQDLLLLSRSVELSKDNLIVDDALVSQVKEDGGFKISAKYDGGLFGAALVGNKGGVLGLVDFREQKPSVIFSKIIEDVLSRALTKATNP